MAGGYMGKVLWVDLSKGTLKDEALDDKFCRNFIGGYGFGARALMSKMKAGADPLGPDNILGFMTGPFTGAPVVSPSRYTVFCKSPLTKGWGDANSGGDFGPGLKFAGYDGVYFTGISPKPVYLYIEEGKAELRDAGKLWGKDSFETEDILKAEHGEEVKMACIGQAGENLSLISCVMNNKGRAAGRSGVGAVMGSKNLKAIAALGSAKVLVASPEAANDVRRKLLEGINQHPFSGLFKNLGTCGITAGSAMSGDSPVKNWGGAGPVDFPTVSKISDAAVIGLQERKYACYRCPFGCGGIMKAGKEYEYGSHAHKPEYETLAAFGTMCLNDNVESIIKANDICNRYGLDTISAGVTIAFAIECFESGILTSKDTGGIELKWGNHRAIIAMTEMLAKREGFGDVLADGVKVASEKIGKNADKYAIHIGGEELPMHDPRLGYHYATTYVMDATPGRHTQGSEGSGPAGLLPQFDPKSFSGRAEAHKRGSAMNHVMNAAGMCMFVYMCLANIEAIPETLNAITGWDTTTEELITTGTRLANLRHAFNIREGINPLAYKLPGLPFGEPKLKAGPLAGVTVDRDTMIKEYLAVMDWDARTTKPSKKVLTDLGLADVAKELYK
jgi:aldehyde:ferredoxin oxidoreductase